MGKIEDLSAEMRSAGLVLDNHMPCTIFVEALPAEYEVEARNLASRDSIGPEVIIKAVRERHQQLSGAGRIDREMVMPCTPVMVPVAATGKVGAAATEKADIRECTDEEVEAPTRSVVARPRLRVAMASAPKPPKVVPQ